MKSFNTFYNRVILEAGKRERLYRYLPMFQKSIQADPTEENRFKLVINRAISVFKRDDLLILFLKFYREDYNRFKMEDAFTRALTILQAFQDTFANAIPQIDNYRVQPDDTLRGVAAKFNAFRREYSPTNWIDITEDNTSYQFLTFPDGFSWFDL